MSTKTKKEATETKEVAKVSENTAVAKVGGSISLASLAQTTGRGIENIGMDDQSPPYFRILQALSAQVKKNRAEYVEGAKEGMFYNSATQKLYDGEKGVLLVPVYFETRYLEYTPKLEGEKAEQPKFVADHGTSDDCTKGLKKEGYAWKTKDGNNIFGVATHYVLHYDEVTGSYTRAIMSMPSSNAKRSRAWNALMSNRIMPAPDGSGRDWTPPSFFTAYRATAVPESKGSNDWYVYKFVPYSDLIKQEEAGGDFVSNLKNGANVFDAADAFWKLIKGGSVKIQQPSDDDVASGGGEADGDADKAF